MKQHRHCGSIHHWDLLPNSASFCSTLSQLRAAVTLACNRSLYKAETADGYGCLTFPGKPPPAQEVGLMNFTI